MLSEIIVKVDKNLANDPESIKSALLKNKEILGARLNIEDLAIEFVKNDLWKITFASIQRRGIEFLLLKAEGVQVVNQDSQDLVESTG